MMTTALPAAAAQSLFIVAYEPGAENPSLPTWASRADNPVGLDPDYHPAVKRLEIDHVPGAFQLTNVFSQQEASNFIELVEQLGFLPDAPVSLARSVRHNDNVTWVVDETLERIIWQRIEGCFANLGDLYQHKRALGLNARFRFYRYQQGDFFKPHTDGSWPGSRVINNELIHNSFSDRWSQLSFLIYLNDDFDGGATQFWVDASNPQQPARSEQNAHKVDVRTPAGGVLCFPHGQHPLHCLHSSEPILSGTKYIIRTDVLFEL